MNGPNVVRDPNITIGEYRLLARSDGMIAIFDARIEGPFKGVSVHPDIADAEHEARRLVAIGSPVLVFDGTIGRSR